MASSLHVLLPALGTTARLPNRFSRGKFQSCKVLAPPALLNSISKSDFVCCILLPQRWRRAEVVAPAAINGDNAADPAVPKTARRGRKMTDALPSSSPPKRRTGRSKKAAEGTDSENEQGKSENVAARRVNEGEEVDEEEEEEYDDGVDFPYEFPPLICCFGEAQREFVPTVRVSDRQMDPDKYSSWKGLQWDPPEFVRAPGCPPSNVAISHVRLGGRAAFMGKVGDDDFGNDLVLVMNKERVQSRAMKIDKSAKTVTSYMKIGFDSGKLKVETRKESAEDSLLRSEINLAVLKEARIFYFNSEVLLSQSMDAALYRAIKWSKKFGGLIFFDLNLPLPLWESRDKTRVIIKKAWEQANIIEVTKLELEFLLDEDYYERRRNYKPQYYAESFEDTKSRRDYYHYTREDISSLWHENIKFLFVTDGTLRIHYYTPDLMVWLWEQRTPL